MGRTWAQATEWASDTSLICKVAAGVKGSVRLAVTTGELVGTETEGMSYDGSLVSAAGYVNEGTTGRGSVTVSGGSFGTARYWQCLLI